MVQYMRLALYRTYLAKGVPLKTLYTKHALPLANGCTGAVLDRPPGLERLTRCTRQRGCTCPKRASRSASFSDLGFLGLGL